jgi:hypothetical protein
MAYCIARVLGSPFLRVPGIKCFVAIFRNFFLLQYKAAFFKGRYPVARADHPLDKKIPFTPRKVNIYLDFVAFWVRVIGFLLRHFGRSALGEVKEFIDSMGSLYKKAAEVYAVCFSTTNRPHYLARPRFVVIHAFDPHLMCIPSLHVMVVIRAYTIFRELIRRLGGEAQFAAQIKEMRRGALDITEAVLYVKQHSVNCISAAMYAMTCFDGRLFTPEEARTFCAGLFLNAPSIAQADRNAIRAHILSLYERFVADGEKSEKWETALLNFLFSLPKTE